MAQAKAIFYRMLREGGPVAFESEARCVTTPDWFDRRAFGPMVAAMAKDEVVRHLGNLGWESPWISAQHAEAARVFVRGGVLVHAIPSDDVGAGGHLTVRDLSFGDVPFIKLRHANEKNRKGSTVAVRSDLASELRGWTAGKDRGDLVFTVPAGLVRIIDRDLAAAGIPKVDADGYVVHVHALRHSFGIHLSKAGVAPRVAQAAMRHSNISLTMGTYTDARLLDTAEAVERLHLMQSKAVKTCLFWTKRAIGP